MLQTTSYSLTNTVLRQTYFKMTLSLLVTAFISLWAVSSRAFLSFIFLHSWVLWALCLAELGIVFYVTWRIQKISAALATALLFVFSAINGLTLAPVFLAYTAISIAKTFFITAGTFGAMSVYGYFTTHDLSGWGKCFMYALFGIIIASLINFFLKSSGLEWVISIVGVLLFVGLTAWDTQQLKAMCAVSTQENAGKLSTYGALNLYLDFINLFLFLLRLFGDRRD